MIGWLDRLRDNLNAEGDRAALLYMRGHVMPDSAIKFDRDATELPDMNGSPVHVGDWVRDRSGQEWQVRGLRPTEDHEEGNLYKKLGTLSLDYSHIDLQRYDSSTIAEFFKSMIFDGRTQTSRSPIDVVKLDLSPEEALDREIERAEVLLSNLEMVGRQLNLKKREAKRRYDELTRKRDG